MIIIQQIEPKQAHTEDHDFHIGHIEQKANFKAAPEIRQIPVNIGVPDLTAIKDMIGEPKYIAYAEESKPFSQCRNIAFKLIAQNSCGNDDYHVGAEKSCVDLEIRFQAILHS